MSQHRSAIRAAVGASVCPSCTAPLVQPLYALPRDRKWLMELWCPNCDWGEEATLDGTQFDRFDADLEAGLEQVANCLVQLTASNMRDYGRRFTAALNADALLPEDF
jgi:hypothetical protein